MKKNIKKKRKKPVVQIEVMKLADGQYDIHTTQLSNLIIPLTELEKTTPAIKSPCPKKSLDKPSPMQKHTSRNLPS
jgi:hypothetical protein